ncbi:MAG TPA: PilZ domain-containing protein [Thermodesulfobacteriota bacterium]|nr:PilZ domain-containing protein [Thermodesulfobacteriota bacterium]
MVPNAASVTYKRAKIQWLTLVKANGKVIEGVTLTVSPTGIFVVCTNPLSLNDTCELKIKIQDRNDPIQATGEVVWSNIHGQDDNCSPRGMGIKFTRISEEDRDLISNEALRHLQQEEKKCDREGENSAVSVDSKRGKSPPASEAEAPA